MCDLVLSEEFRSKYILRELIGRGGWGQVWSATQRNLGRTVAVKFLDVLPEGPLHSLRRFRHEARIAAGLQHPGIVKVFDFGVEGENPYLVMELVQGPTMRKVIESGARPSTRESVGLLAQLADALAHLHGRSIVHRDVKPENVFLASAGGLVLGDFGLAREIDGTNLTGTGVVLGTSRYIAPELYEGGRCSPTTDLYATGVTAFELLTGRPPFPGSEAAAVVQKLDRSPISILALEPSLGSALASLVDRLLERDPRRRPASASDVLAELSTWLDSARDRAPASRRPSRQPSPAGGATAAVPANETVPVQDRTVAVPIPDARINLRSAAAVAVLVVILAGVGRVVVPDGAPSPAVRTPSLAAAVADRVALEGAIDCVSPGALLDGLSREWHARFAARTRTGEADGWVSDRWAELESRLRRCRLLVLSASLACTNGTVVRPLSRADLPLYRKLHQLTDLALFFERVSAPSHLSAGRRRLLRTLTDVVPARWRESGRPAIAYGSAFTLRAGERPGERAVSWPPGPYARHTFASGPATSLFTDADPRESRVEYRHGEPVPIPRPADVDALEVGIGIGDESLGTFVVELRVDDRPWTDVAVLGRFAPAASGATGRSGFLALAPDIVSGRRIQLGIRLVAAAAGPTARLQWLQLRWTSRPGLPDRR